MSWQLGTEWLRDEFYKWPVNQKIDCNISLPELKKQFDFNVNWNSIEFNSVGGKCNLIDLFNATKYSNYSKLLHVTAYVLKYINISKKEPKAYKLLSS